MGFPLPPYQAHTQSLCLPPGERVFLLPGLALQDSDTDHSDASWPVGGGVAAWRVGKEGGGEEGERREGGGRRGGREGRGRRRGRSQERERVRRQGRKVNTYISVT